MEDCKVADVVPVVRCKDCEYKGTTFCIAFGINPYGEDEILTDNEFCSWGKRKESENA